MTINDDEREGAPLHLLAFGAGALGTYIAGSLALNGQRVVFLERPEVAAELKREGLHLTINKKTHTLSNPIVVGSLKEALEHGPYDAAIFALKSFDTMDALESMAAYLEDIPPVLCLQNGVDNETRLEEVLGKEKVIAGTATSAIGRRGPGNIVLEKLRGAGVHADHPISARLVDAFNESGLNARMYANAADMKWSKMLTNLMVNASSAILDMTPTEILAHPKLYRMELEQLREALRVMQAHNFQVVDLPGTPVRALTFAVRSLPAALSNNLIKNAVGGGRGGKMPSFHIDLHYGRGKSEVDYLNGAVVRYGEIGGVSTPVNRLLNETLLKLTEGKIPLEVYAKQPEKLLNELKLIT